MNQDTVVSVKNVSKKFCMNLKRSMAYGIADLSKNLFGIKPDSTSLRKDEFWALDDINFELKKGETLGIMGANGSGKSTLLRLLTGIFPPDIGEIQTKGRIGALIAVGAGFHPHMTGRENIYLNGTILGMNKRELDQKFDEIIDFAEIANFIDAPVSTYSSGMYVRLGFSIAIHSIPNILIADEVLSVGDYMFRMKCYDKMLELLKKDCTIILVSHSEIAIRSVCEKTAILHHNRLIDVGNTDDMIIKYRSLMIHEHLSKKNAVQDNGNLFTPKTNIIGGVAFKKIEIRDKNNQIIRINHKELKKIKYSRLNKIVLILEFEVFKMIEHPRISLYIRDMSKAELTYVLGSSVSIKNYKSLQTIEKGYKRLVYEMDISKLTPNVYMIIAVIGDDQYHLKIYNMIDDTDNMTIEIVNSEKLVECDALLNKPYFLPDYKFEFMDVE